MASEVGEAEAGLKPGPSDHQDVASIAFPIAVTNCLTKQLNGEKKKIYFGSRFESTRSIMATGLQGHIASSQEAKRKIHACAQLAFFLLNLGS